MDERWYFCTQPSVEGPVHDDPSTIGSRSDSNHLPFDIYFKATLPFCFHILKAGVNISESFEP